MERGQVIRVLGPIDVVTTDGARTIGSRNTRIVLGCLVVGVGHAVPADRLAFALWGDKPPPSVSNTLQSYVSRLRHLLGADAVVSEDHSYKLAAAPDQIDALEFERLVGEAVSSRADPERCLPLCQQALALWRGNAFGELGDEEPFRLEALRLEELRLVTMELSLEAELALDRHELVVGELESAVEEHPYRERLWYLLVEALVRNDRRVEAVRTCERLRGLLAEVGIEPSPQLTHLEDEILTSDHTALSNGSL